MADLSLTPIGTQVKPVQGMSLTDVINFARGAQEYGARAELIPELLKQQRATTTTTQMDLARRQYQEIANANTALINDPLIVEAAESAGKGTPQDQEIQKARLTELVRNASAPIAKRFNIPQEQLDQSIAPIVQQIQQDPSQLRKRLIQLHTENLDEATKMGLFKGELQSVNTAEGTVLFERGYGAQRKQNEPVVFIPKNVPITERVKETTDAAGNPVYTIYDENGLPVRTNITQDQLGDTVLQRLTLEKQFAPVSPKTTGVETRAVSETLPKGKGIRAPENTGLGPNDYKPLQEQVTVTRGSLRSAEDALKQVDNVETYLDRALVGVGSEKVNKALSALGWVKLSEAERVASAREIVKKSLAALTIHQNATNNGKLAADLQQANDASANPELTDPAIRKVVGDIKVMMQHQKNYTSGLDKLINKYPQYGAFNKALYDTAMNDVYEIEAIELNNLLQDKKLTNAQKKEKGQELLDKYGVDQFSELNSKAKLYNNLINGNVQIVDGKLVPITGK